MTVTLEATDAIVGLGVALVVIIIAVTIAIFFGSWRR